MPDQRSFADLVAEGEAVPVEGWDFSWFDGRATEERPSWGYARMMAARMAGARAALDIQTGGGEVLATALAGHAPPPVLAATESWPPNLALAAASLRPLGGRVVQAADDGGLPFGAEPSTWWSAGTRSRRCGRRSPGCSGRAAATSPSRSGRAPTGS